MNAPTFLAMTCKYNGVVVPCRGSMPVIVSRAAIIGPKLWALFHLWTLSFKGTPEEGLQWLKEFDAQVATIPLCTCAQHWAAIRAANPPIWDNLFEWGVDRHNDVNRLRGVSCLTLEEALQFWRNQATIQASKSPNC